MVLRRKLSQELGDQFSYDVGKQVALMRHQRVEATATKPTVHIFAVGYECIFRSGSIRLSTQHIESKWAPIETLDPNDYFSGGWLAGVETYLQYRLGSS